jgi:hypothetical protein
MRLKGAYRNRAHVYQSDNKKCGDADDDNEQDKSQLMLDWAGHANS